MSIVFEKPPTTRSLSAREAGGDNEVERDGLGRPRIRVTCNKCEGEGRLPSTKKPPPATVKCLTCSGEGWRLRSYTRVTTYIDVLDDKSNLMAWDNRMVLIGAAMDTGFLKGVLDVDPETREGRDLLNRRAEAAKEFAGASRKSDKGTELHILSEIVDQGQELPDDVDLDDWQRMFTYAEATKSMLSIVHMEQLVVNDELGVAGTPDRVSTFLPDVPIVAPNGYQFSPDELLITDLKTGRVDYGGLKMCMQLAIYSRSDRYDKETGERIPLGNINQEWGLIMHTPAFAEKPVTTLYWADLTLGWEAVLVARQIRSLRSRGRKALTPFAFAGAEESVTKFEAA